MSKRPAGVSYSSWKIPAGEFRGPEWSIKFLATKGGVGNYDSVTIHDAQGYSTGYAGRMTYQFSNKQDLKALQTCLNQGRNLETIPVQSIRIVASGGIANFVRRPSQYLDHAWLSISEGTTEHPDPVLSVFEPRDDAETGFSPTEFDLGNWDLQNLYPFGSTGLRVNFEKPEAHVGASTPSPSLTRDSVLAGPNSKPPIAITANPMLTYLASGLY